MNSVKILHCADIHIGASVGFLGEKAASRCYETLITFERIVDTAAENGVKLLLIAGDLFDSNDVDETLVSAVFSKIAAVSDIQVVFAAGNHDPLNLKSPFKTHNLPQNLHILTANDDCISLENIKTRVYGRSFETAYLKGKSRFSITPKDDGYINIMLLHGELKSDLSSNYNSITPEFVKYCNMNYIALGHIHKRSEIGKLGKTYFAYCGCPEGQGFDETGEKGVLMGEISENVCDLSFVPLARRLHIKEKVDISGAAGTTDICEKILNQLQEKYGGEFADNLYKIELVGTADEVNTTEISGRISDIVYYVKIKDCTEPMFDLEAKASEISLKGIYCKIMKKKIEAADEKEAALLKKALVLGLRAFNSEVAYNEN